MVKFRLLGLGAGTYATILAKYDTSKSTRKLMRGLMNKFRRHWFVLICIDNQIYPVDAYSSNRFSNASFIDEYLNQYRNNKADGIIVLPNKR